MQSSCSKQGMYAGFWIRCGAYVIDCLVVEVLLLFLNRPLSAIVSMILGNLAQAEILFTYTILDILLYFLRAAYFILFTYYTGATVGKRVLHLQVVSQGTKPSLWNLIYRETIGRFLCTVCFHVGYIVAGFDREKRGFHDMLSDTRVIYERPMMKRE